MKSTPIATDYTAFLTEVKGRIQTARLQAGRAVNRELVMLYWDIGRGIVEKQQVAGWGDGVVERLAADLRAEFPDMRGFSSRSIWEMKRFYVACTEPDFLQQLVAEFRKTRGTGHFDFLQQAVADFAVTHNQPLEQPVPESGGSTENSILGQAVPETLSQAVRELVAAVPWGHHVLLLGKIKDSAAMFFLPPRHGAIRLEPERVVEPDQRTGV